MNDHADSRSCDAEAARLLPWYVSGRLDAADMARVARHLERCDICREDLVQERSIRAVLKDESSLHYAPQPGLAKMMVRIDEMARIDALERDAPSVTAAAAGAPAALRPRTPAPGEAAPLARRLRRFSAVPWLAAAVLVQVVALGALAAILFNRPLDAGRDARYATLSSASPALAAGPRIRAVFSPEVTIGAFNALLAGQALTIVSGPGTAGAYTLALTGRHPDSGRLERAIAALRASPAVQFAEPAVNDEVAGH
jgi:hypothetical protein